MTAIAKLGDIVIYTQPKSETAVNGTRHHPAIITRDWGGNCVNLLVLFDAMGMDIQTSVQCRDMVPQTDDTIEGFWDGRAEHAERVAAGPPEVVGS